MVAHQGGTNRIAEYDTVLFYGDPQFADLTHIAGERTTEVLVAEPDSILSLYGRVTPYSQAYADLFSLPGWQAARFIEELDIRRIAASDEPVLLL